MAHRTDQATRTDIDEIIEEATQLLIEAAYPEKIILFGSYARGNFTEDSDLDFLVIVPSVEDRIEEMARLRLVLREVPIAIDLVVYTHADVENRGHLPGTMLYHALQEGRVLHDAA